MTTTIVPTYPTSIIYEMYVSGAWLDITHDVIGKQQVDYGIAGNSLTDRVALTGTVSFILRNDLGCIGGVQGYYSPGCGVALPGFDKGIQFKQTITYAGLSFIKFLGHITKIKPHSGYDETVDVLVADWMDYSALHPIFSPTMGFNEKIEDVVAAIVALMPAALAPLETDYGSGSDTFPTTFDTVTENTRALSEFTKVALSELGYIYLRRGTTGEKLVAEGRSKRLTLGTPTTITVPPVPVNLLCGDGDDLLCGDGDNLLALWADSFTAAFSDTFMDAAFDYGATLFNRLSVKSYPRKIDSAATTILFTLQQRISLAAGETKANYRGTFRDPLGAATRVTGKDMVAPVMTTDYTLRANQDGSGANYDAALTITAVYGANDALYTFTNTGANAGWVWVQARGKGIYLYDPIEYVAEDAVTSQPKYGVIPQTIDMKYQYNPGNASILADVLLQQNKVPRMNLNSITFLANYSPQAMLMFLTLDIGDLIAVSESKNGVSSNFYINSVSYAIKAGGYILCTFGLVEATSMGTTFWLLEDAALGILDSTTILGY